MKISEVSKNAGKGVHFPRAISLCALASAIIVTGCGGSNDESIDRTNELLIKNVSIVSAERAATSEPQDVLIRDDRIAEIGLDLSDQGLAEDKIGRAHV